MIFILPLLLIFTGANPVSNMSSATYTYLALGDSYTIGENVLFTENFPYQTVQLLRKTGYEFHAPEIIAKTGWTTDELQAVINKHKFLPAYDFVTLLIGVNNQYLGRTVENYKPEFENILKQAIRFTGNKADQVIVVSIPDWGATSFAAGREQKQISNEIDDYNDANKSIAEKYNVNYVDITPGTREAANDPSLVAGDGLHPSAKEYSRWANKIHSVIISQLK